MSPLFKKDMFVDHRDKGDAIIDDDVNCDILCGAYGDDDDDDDDDDEMMMVVMMMMEEIMMVMMSTIIVI